MTTHNKQSTKHTPGKWRSWSNGVANAPTIIYTGDRPPTLDPSGRGFDFHGGHYVAEVPVHDGADFEQETANVLVIRAASEMLEALREVERGMGHSGQCHIYAHATSAPGPCNCALGIIRAAIATASPSTDLTRGAQ